MLSGTVTQRHRDGAGRSSRSIPATPLEHASMSNHRQRAYVRSHAEEVMRLLPLHAVLLDWRCTSWAACGDVRRLLTSLLSTCHPMIIVVHGPLAKDDYHRRCMVGLGTRMWK